MKKKNTTTLFYDSDPTAGRSSGLVAHPFRDFGYADLTENTVRYASAAGVAKVLFEVNRLRGTAAAAVERRHRIKAELGDGFWATVHSVRTTAAGRRRTELTAGTADGTVVAVTEREPGTLVAVARTADDDGGGLADPSSYAWPDGRPVLEIRGDDEAVVVEALDGTRIVAEFGDRADVLCDV